MAVQGTMKQNGFTGEIRPVVKLVTHSVNPVGTLFAAWHGTRNDIPLDPEVIQDLYDYGVPEVDDFSDYYKEYHDTAEEILRAFPDAAKKYDNNVQDVIRDIVESTLKYNIPVSEAVQFTFEIDNASVAWREQLVRGRQGQNFWIQSTRPMDLRTMDINRSKSVEMFGGEEAVKIYDDCADVIRQTYEKLVELGVPQEDIRLQPQMHVHRVYWFVSLRSLLTVLSKRCDWIAQASLWTPIVSGCIKCLRDIGMYDVIKNIVGKPPVTVDYDTDFNDYHVIDYKNIQDCEARMSGADPAPIDPLYLAYANKTMPEHTDLEFYDYLKSMYIQIWSDEYLKVLGWDREDPNKIGPYDRPVK